MRSSPARRTTSGRRWRDPWSGSHLVIESVDPWTIRRDGRQADGLTVDHLGELQRGWIPAVTAERAKIDSPPRRPVAGRTSSGRVGAGFTLGALRSEGQVTAWCSDDERDRGSTVLSRMALRHQPRGTCPMSDGPSRPAASPALQAVWSAPEFRGGLIVVSAALGVIPAFLLKDLLNNVLTKGTSMDTTELNVLIAGMVAIPIITGAIGVAQVWQSNLIGQQVMHDLRTAVYVAPATAVAALLHRHPHRRGAVAHRQRHRRRARPSSRPPRPRSSRTSPRSSRPRSP